MCRSKAEFLVCYLYFSYESIMLLLYFFPTFAISEYIPNTWIRNQ